MLRHEQARHCQTANRADQRVQLGERRQTSQHRRGRSGRQRQGSQSCQPSEFNEMLVGDRCEFEVEQFQVRHAVRRFQARTTHARF